MRRYLTTVAIVAFFGLAVVAQDAGLQAKLQDVKVAAARNKLALTQYTWQEQQTVSVNGEVKQQTLYQVQLGPDGQPQKTALTAPQPPPAAQGGRLRQRIVQNKTNEFKEYAQQVGALVHAYSVPDPDKLQQVFQAGNMSLGSEGGGSSLALTFHSYLKADDTYTLVLNPQDKSMQSVQVASYLDDPSNAVTFSANFSKLPDGTNHVQSSTVNGQQKQLQIQSMNNNYLKLH